MTVVDHHSYTRNGDHLTRHRWQVMMAEAPDLDLDYLWDEEWDEEPTVMLPRLVKCESCGSRVPTGPLHAVPVVDFGGH